MSVTRRCCTGPACQHRNQIDDITTGSIICTDCCQVLDWQLFETRSCLAPVTDSVLHHRFQDVCANSCAPLGFAEAMHDLYRTCLKTHCITLFQKDALIALSYYEVLKQHKIPRTLKEVSAITGVSCKQLMMMLKKVFPQSCPIQPCDIIQRFCAKLGLHGRQCIAIERDLASWTRQDASSPDTICAGVIYQYVRKHTLAIPMKEICEVCGVTRVSIHRYQKRQDHVSHA